jgi:hypothetical protein
VFWTSSHSCHVRSAQRDAAIQCGVAQDETRLRNEIARHLRAARK